MSSLTLPTNQSKLWRENHREQYNKILNDYYHKNKEKLLEKKTCEICGVEYTKMNKSSHYKTKFHIAVQDAFENGKKQAGK